MAIKKLKPISNFNRIIDLKFYAGEESTTGFEIKCPTSGRKPDIEIEGTIGPNDNMTGFTVRVKNLYTTKILDEFYLVKAICGYEKKKNSTFYGSVTNVYTESPGPDRVTVIECTTGNYSDWVEVTGDYYFEPGFTLIEALEKFSKDLKFKDVKGDETLLNKTSSVSLSFTGCAKDCVHRLREYFPEAKITVRNGGFMVINPADSNPATVKIPYLCTPPQITGNSYTVVAPWEPDLRPGDRVEVQTTFATKDIGKGAKSSGTAGQSEKKTLTVESIQFHFGTISGNEMTILALEKGE